MMFRAHVRSLMWAAAPLFLFATAACSSDAANARPQDGSVAVPLYDNLGDLHYPVTTRSADAQRYFDQGLRLTYAFNHPEGIRAFREAQRLDADCAMCYWGEALALGPNINLPMDSAAAVTAKEAVDRAVERIAHATDRESALILALAERYADEDPAARARQDSAYARAMRTVAERYPDDVDVQTLYAESLMNLSPWAYWEGKRPRPATREILARLERAVERNPNHPGACHFYIHAVEAAHPERAVPCAERLAALMPGAGHLVHMPAHIYIRVGRWADAITANEHAVHSDETYIADSRPESVYPLLYYPHNIHFLSFAATMAGRSQLALGNADQLPGHLPADVAEQFAEIQLVLSYPWTARVTFAKWDELIARPLPSESLPITRGLAQYAQGVAHAARRDGAAARRSLDGLRTTRAATDDAIGSAVLAIAEHALEGEIALRRGTAVDAIPHFREAARLEDELQYMEPPFWYYPIRHSLGVALLEAGQAAQAERVYREDLERFPENGWALKGLALALRAQGKGAEATEVEQRLARAWSAADITLPASRL